MPTIYSHPLSRQILFAGFLIFAACCVNSDAASGSTLFWGESIDNAISQRDSFFKEINFSPPAFMASAGSSIISDDQKEQIKTRLYALQYPNSPWHAFMLGMTASKFSIDSLSFFYNRCLSLAENDPGTIWLLFVEFARFGNNIWAETALQQLEKLLLSEGALCAPAISQQLLQYSNGQEQAGNAILAQNYSLWARRFDPNLIWTPLHNAIHSFPYRLSEFFVSAGDIFTIVKQSWEVQLSIAYYMHFWIRSIAIALIFCILFVFLFKYMGIALHRGSDLFPLPIPGFLRIFLAFGILLSLASFGILILTWVLIFLLSRQVQRNEQFALIIAACLVTLAPLDALVESSLSRARSPDSSIGMYAHAKNEGYSRQLHSQILHALVAEKEDELLSVGAALCAMKNGELDGAIKHINSALAIRQSDPVALMLGGDIYFLSNSPDRALEYYTACSRLYPRTVAAPFNAAQCYIAHMQTLQGSDFIRQAAKLDPAYVNSFIEKNDNFFSKNVPPIRRIMPADYPPSYFWRSVFPSESGWARSRDLWGASFFGFPPLVSLFIFALFLIALCILAYVAGNARKPRQYYSCNICGRTICRRCKQGMMCISCAEAVQLVKNESTIERIRMSIVNRQKKIKLSLVHLAGMLIPGIDGLLKPKVLMIQTLLLLFVTVMAYATYFSITQVHFYYPSWVSQDIVNYIRMPLVIYFCFFAIKGLIAIIKVLRSEAE